MEATQSRCVSCHNFSVEKNVCVLSACNYRRMNLTNRSTRFRRKSDEVLRDLTGHHIDNDAKRLLKPRKQRAIPEESLLPHVESYGSKETSIDD